MLGPEFWNKFGMPPIGILQEGSIREKKHPTKGPHLKFAKRAMLKGQTGLRKASLNKVVQAGLTTFAIPSPKADSSSSLRCARATDWTHPLLALVLPAFDSAANRYAMRHQLPQGTPDNEQLQFVVESRLYFNASNG